MTRLFQLCLFLASLALAFALASCGFYCRPGLSKGPPQSRETEPWQLKAECLARF